MNIVNNTLDKIAFAIHSNIPRPINAWKARKRTELTYWACLRLTKGTSLYWREQAVIMSCLYVWVWLMDVLEVNGMGFSENVRRNEIPIDVLNGVTPTNVGESMLAGLLKYDYVEYLEDEGVVSRLTSTGALSLISRTDEMYRKFTPFTLRLFNKDTVVSPSKFEPLGKANYLHDYLDK